jgi:hypothetical protein
VSSSLFPAEGGNAPTEPFRRAAVQALQAWVARAYAPHTLGAAVAVKGAEVFYPGPCGSASASAPASLVVVTSVTVTNLKNFWAGSFRGRYTVTFPAPNAADGAEGGSGGSGAAAGGASLSGSVRVLTHYFEGGNVQMRDGKEVKGVKLAFDSASPDSFAAALVKAVAAVEDSVLAGLDGTYDALAGAALKEVRRALPVSGSKFSWNIAGHRMVRSLAAQGVGGGEK